MPTTVRLLAWCCRSTSSAGLSTKPTRTGHSSGVGSEKEAYAKVGGLGMDRHLTAHTFTGPQAQEEQEGLTIRDVPVENGLVAAIAVPVDRTVRHRGRWLGKEAA